MVGAAVPLTGFPLLLREPVRLLIRSLGSMVRIRVHLLSCLGASFPSALTFQDSLTRLFRT